MSIETAVRQHTVFQLCSRHDWLAREGRRRMAEFFCEGGPTTQPCAPESCKVRPGTDLFTADICGQREWFDTADGEHIFRWPVNESTPHPVHNCTGCGGIDDEHPFTPCPGATFVPIEED